MPVRTAIRFSSLRRCALLGSMLALPTLTLAQGTPPEWRGLYAGGGGAYTTVSVEVGGGCGRNCDDWYYYPAYDEGDGDYGFVGHVGYRFNRFVAAELSYLDAGTIAWKENHVYLPDLGGYFGNYVEFDSTMPAASALLILPFFDRWETYLRLGAGYWEGTSHQVLFNEYTGEVLQRDVEDSGLGWMIGIGLGVSFAQAWHVRLDLQTASVDGDMFNTLKDTGLDSMLLELQYRFGASRPATPNTASPAQ